MTKPSSYGKATAKPFLIFWVISFFFIYIFFFYILLKEKEDLFSNRELLRDAEGFQVMTFSKDNQNETHQPHTVWAVSRSCSRRVPSVILLSPLGSWCLLFYFTTVLRLWFWCFSIVDAALTPDCHCFRPTHMYFLSFTINVIVIWPFYDFFCLSFVCYCVEPSKWLNFRLKRDIEGSIFVIYSSVTTFNFFNIRCQISSKCCVPWQDTFSDFVQIMATNQDLKGRFSNLIF